MGAQILVGGIEIGLVAGGLVHAAWQVIRDQDLGAPAKVGEGPHVGANPIGQPLGPGGLGIGVVARPQHRDEDMRSACLARQALDDRHGLPRIVHKALLARALLLAHDQIELAGPGPVLLTEPAVLKPLRRASLILLPEQEQAHALPGFELPVHRLPNGHGPLFERQRRRRGKQPLLQGALVELLRERPADSGGFRPA
jgi:hypothetical protein